MIEITINEIPLPWKAPYVGTRGAFSPRYHETKIIRHIIAEQYKGPILDEAIICDLFFFMPIPTSISKKKRAAMLAGTIRPAVTPDRSNMAKFYEDCLQGLVIKNDSKIVDGRVAKWYDDHPKTIIRIYPLNLN